MFSRIIRSIQVRITKGMPLIAHQNFINFFVIRYEHLGDTVLGMAVTHLLMKLFPCIRVGPSTVCALSFGVRQDRIKSHLSLWFSENTFHDGWQSYSSRDVGIFPYL